MERNRKDFSDATSAAARVSRRRFLGKVMVGAAAMSGVLTAAGGPAAKEKVSKAAAHYQDHPNKGQRCGGCTHFVFGGCTLVAGSISSNGWCKLFKASG